MKNARLRYYAIIVLGEFQIHFGIRKQKPSSLKEGFHKELLQTIIYCLINGFTILFSYCVTIR
jgi:hypothetical protein